MFAAGSAMLAFFLLRRTYARLGKRTRGGSGPHLDAQPRPTDAWTGARADLDANFSRRQVELYELSRELRGKLDSKIIILNELVEQSQRQIERLETLLEETESREAPVHAEER